MVGLTSLEVDNSIFYIIEGNNKIDIFTDTFDDFSIEDLKDEVEEIFSISDITPSHPQ